MVIIRIFSIFELDFILLVIFFSILGNGKLFSFLNLVLSFIFFLIF